MASAKHVSGRLGRSLQIPKDPADKLLAIRNLREHRSQIAQDKCLLNASWGFGPSSGILVLTIDGMDQAKFRIPRARKHRSSADFQKYLRPKVIVIGVWIAGLCLALYLCDGTQPHDSNLTVEVLARAFERARVRLADLGLPFPTEIQLWALL